MYNIEIKSHFRWVSYFQRISNVKKYKKFEIKF